MKKDALKSHLSLVLLCVAAGIVPFPAIAQTRNAELIAKLFVLLGPDRAREYLYELEQKHKKLDAPIVTPPAPITPPVTPRPTPKPAPETPPVTIQPPMAPAIPTETGWITSVEREDFTNASIRLHAYMTKVLECLKDFMNKNNHDPYRNHVACFKAQLHFIQSQLQQYPPSHTPAAVPLFNALKKIAVALEKCENLICQALDREYSKTPVGALTLGSAMSQMQSPVNQQRAIINQQIGFLRNELRKAHATDMLESINSLNTAINNTFSYGSDKTYNELLGILTHRLKK